MYTYIYTSKNVYLCFECTLKNLKLIVTALVIKAILVQKTSLVKYHLIKKTGKQIKLLVGKCVVCNRKKSMIVSDNTIHAEGLGDFFKNLGKISAKAGKKLARNVLSNPGRALDLTAKIATAAATKSPKTVLSTFPEVIKFYH